LCRSSAMNCGIAVLGIALGSSQAVGYVTPEGNITSWLNELAFAPVDYNPRAPVDEWSGDYGCGAQYFSQQCIGRLTSKAGLVLNPATPLSYLDYTLEKLDLVLLMSVNPGFGGQKFIASVLPKISEVRRRITAAVAATGKPIWLEVDGGVKLDNIAEIARAGADTFVAGSAIFGSKDYAATLREMRQRLGVL